MEPRYLEIDGNRIAVYESGGSGPEILLIHGNSSNARTFKHQLGGAFGAGHRVVALDLPGHGNSAPAADPEATYTLGGYAAIVAELVARLALAAPVLVGWSLGGHIALEAAPDLSEAAGFFIYGTPPIAIPPAMGEAFLPHPAMGVSFAAEVGKEEAEAYAEAFLRPGATAPPWFREAVLATDGRARAQLGASVGTAAYKDEVEIVANLDEPLAIVHGAEEQLVSADYLRTLTAPSLWRGEIHIIEGAGHAPHWEQPEQFNALLGAFVAEVGHRLKWNENE